MKYNEINMIRIDWKTYKAITYFKYRMKKIQKSGVFFVVVVVENSISDVQNK